MTVLHIQGHPEQQEHNRTQRRVRQGWEQLTRADSSFWKRLNPGFLSQRLSKSSNDSSVAADMAASSNLSVRSPSGCSLMWRRPGHDGTVMARSWAAKSRTCTWAVASFGSRPMVQSSEQDWSVKNSLSLRRSTWTPVSKGTPQCQPGQDGDIC